MTDIETRSGYVAIVGRPNVGKSTLLNAILGQKLSITSKKPQTTRHQVLGVVTQDSVQTIYVDTPGIHRQGARAINRYMNRAATSALVGVNLVVWLVEAERWTEEDAWVLQQLQNVEVPVILAINKIDRLSQREAVLPFMQQVEQQREFAAMIPMSALKKDNIDTLQQEIQRFIPVGPHYFDADQITDRSQRFFAAEIVREKLTRNLGQEVPYGLTVDIEQFEQEDGLITIHALILVEREGQKRIIIGQKGQMLKTIGQAARVDMETLFDCKVFLKTWVKVKQGWADDERMLHSLGYQER